MDTAEHTSEPSPIDNLKSNLNLSRAQRKMLDRVAAEHLDAPLREIMGWFAYAWGEVGHRLDEPDDVERADMYQLPLDNGHTDMFLNTVYDQINSGERQGSPYIVIFGDSQLRDPEEYGYMYGAYLPLAVKATQPPRMDPPGMTWAKDLDQ